MCSKEDRPESQRHAETYKDHLTTAPIIISYFAPNILPYRTIDEARVAARNQSVDGDNSNLWNNGWGNFQSQNLTTIKTLANKFADFRPVNVSN